MSDSRGSSSSGGSKKNGARRAAGVRKQTPTPVKGSSRTQRAAGTGAAAGAGSASGSGRRAAQGGPAGAKGASAGTKGSGGSGSGKRAAATGAAGAAATKAATSSKNVLNYPRAGKKGAWRWIPSLRLIVGAVALMVIAGVAAMVWLYSTTDVPEPSDVAVAQTSRVYFSDGKTEMGKFSDINRTILPSDEIPDNVKDSVVASEDTSFYENRGVSPRGIVRAFVNNLGGGPRQGGSTITQQYVERYYTGTTTSYWGKAKEAMMALKIDQEISKDEILSRYLNTIYFGRGAYGIQEASQAYFGKDAKDLTDEEAALLVAVIPGPSAYDPAENPERAEQLWTRVLERRVNATGTLTAAEADPMEFPETIDPASENIYAGTDGYLLNEVKGELIDQGLTEDQIDTGGYTIVSTIDVGIQENTVEAIAQLPEDRPEKNRVGTLTMDPKTGAIKGMYGGPDYVSQSYNDATQSRMQGGSIFKTFTLVGALQEGYSLYSQWPGNSPQNFEGYSNVNNFGDNDYGTVNLLQATTNSINTAYVALNLDMGPKHTQEAAIQLGLPESTPGLDGYGSNVLGAASPTVQEMAVAYSTIANEGVHHDAYIVKTVTDPAGEVTYEHEDTPEQVLDEGVAINATVALQGPPSDGSARYVRQNMDGRPVAGKTGTSESFKSAWFVGFTPQLVTAVGMFQPSEDGKSEEPLSPFGGEDQITGSTFPTQIWTNIMEPSLEGQEELEFKDAVQLDNQKSRSDDGVENNDSNSGDNQQTRAPEREEPETEEPTTEEPTTEEPTTEEPTTEEPTTEAPTPTEKPTPEEEPTTEPKPTTKAPPTTKKPVDPPEDGEDQGNGNDNGNGGEGEGETG